MFFILAALPMFSLGKREKNKNDFFTVEVNGTKNIDDSDKTHRESSDMIKIVGKVQIYGTDPFTFVGILDQNGSEYAVYPPEKEEEIRTLQGHLIEFQVVFANEQRSYGGLFLEGGTVIPVTWKIIQ
jgi:hypothetical protein